jgi:peptide/nickel transport system permease protein
MRPSAEYWLGTDSNGQDIFWIATFAVRNSLTIALIAGLVSRVIAVTVGMVAGYLGGKSDRALMFVSDSLLVIPLFLMIVMLAMLIRDNLSVVSLGLLLAIFGWAWDARLIRSQILSLREREFTKTAVLSGTGTIRLVMNEYMPYSTPLIFSTLINNMAWAIGLEITLAILGLLDISIPTLGTMLYWAINYQAVLLGRWWWVLTPITCRSCSSSPSTGCRSASANTSIRADAFSAWGQRNHHGQHDSPHRSAARLLRARCLRETKGPQSGQRSRPGDPGGRNLRHRWRERLRQNDAAQGAGRRGRAAAARDVGSVTTASPAKMSMWRRSAPEEKRKLRLEYIAYVPQGSMSVLNPVARIRDTYRDFIESHITRTTKRKPMIWRRSIFELGLPQKSWMPIRTSSPAECASA